MSDNLRDDEPSGNNTEITNNEAPSSAPNTSSKEPKKKGHKARGCLTAIGIFILICVVITAINGGSKSSNTSSTITNTAESNAAATNNSASSVVTSNESAANTVTSNTTASNNAAATTTTNSTSTTSTVTVSQKNALSKAKDYLAYAPFSYTGLISQLEYEQFSTEDATYAADNCGADWMAQAAKKAADYMNYSSFSRGSLIDQLEYDGFTEEQAEHGADSVGL